MLEKKIPFEQLTSVDIVSLARVFEIEDISRLFDVDLKKVQQKVKAANRVREEQKKDEKYGETNTKDFDFAIRAMIKLAEGYLEMSSSEGTIEEKLKLIDAADKLLKAFDRMEPRIIKFKESRDFMGLIKKAISVSPDKNKIWEILTDDKYMRTLV